ncbi:MAG: hypothetical protein WCA01_08615 [Burkholderiales bacterium]
MVEISGCALNWVSVPREGFPVAVAADEVRELPIGLLLQGAAPRLDPAHDPIAPAGGCRERIADQRAPPFRHGPAELPANAENANPIHVASQFQFRAAIERMRESCSV